VFSEAITSNEQPREKRALSQVGGIVGNARVPTAVPAAPAVNAVSSSEEEEERREVSASLAGDGGIVGNAKMIRDVNL